MNTHPNQDHNSADLNDPRAAGVDEPIGFRLTALAIVELGRAPREVLGGAPWSSPSTEVAK
jgi:hypothetical protein